MECAEIVDIESFRNRRRIAAAAALEVFGNLPCPSCDMLVGASALKGAGAASYVCDGGGTHDSEEWLSDGAGRIQMGDRCMAYYRY